MPDSVLDKIKYLCKSIPEVEWSGILFYSVKGSIKNPKNMEIVLEDILPLDKGTSVFTSYDIGDEHIDYLMEDDKRMEWTMGHVHSHNTMNVYFSGTDMSELNDNAPAHNFYLSLIVNNYMDFTAKVAFVGTMERDIEEIDYMGLDENGEKYTVMTQKIKVKKEKLFIHDCLIKSSTEEIKVEKTFAEKVKGVIKKAEEKLRPKKKTTTGKVSNKNFSKQVERELDDWGTGENLFERSTRSIENFAACVLNFSIGVKDDITAEDILIQYEVLKMTGKELSESVMHTYPAIYSSYFQDDDMDPEDFVRRTELCVEHFEELETYYPQLNETVDQLRSMLLKFESYEFDQTV